MAGKAGYTEAGGWSELIAASPAGGSPSMLDNRLARASSSCCWCPPWPWGSPGCCIVCDTAPNGGPNPAATSRITD